ncbi:uncharacterized protein K02A2.6-like [Formica exsecta]|uniref:uncharacterized protein K02A2.6-like n=1 Tax=Formica exsecta TaxID=72781 RepID=UPI001141B66A|nr:uncharacterized protein K02A2.6-like [Formica exsecta]
MPKLEIYETDLKPRSYCKKKSFVPIGFVKVKVNDINSVKYLNMYVAKYDGIIHKRMAPYHSASNGLAERFVQTLKQSLRKIKLTKDNVKVNVQKFLFHYRITPIPELKKSPAEIMFGRKLRNRLDLILPKELAFKVESMKCNNETRNFQVGAKIAAREYLNKKINWRFGIVFRKLGKLHYLVKLENGKMWKRHVDQLCIIGQDVQDVKSKLDLDVFDGIHPNQNVTKNIRGGERPVINVTNKDCVNDAANAPAEEETEEDAHTQITVGNKKEMRTSEQNETEENAQEQITVAVAFSRVRKAQTYMTLSLCPETPNR